MEINGPGQNRLIGKIIRILYRALDYRSANLHIISGNIANIDTPGYRHKELSFDQELQRAADKDNINLNTTDPGHYSNASASKKGDLSIRSRDAESGESGELNLDMEMAKMMRNNLLYEASARLLSKKFQALKAAIEAGRR